MAVINIDDVYILGETGAEVDKVTGLFTKDENTTNGEKAFAQLNIGTAGSNDNLLDNAYFVGGGSQLGDGHFPINQRGQSSYASDGTGIDRWKQFAATVTLENDGVTVTPSAYSNNFLQLMNPAKWDALVGETVTLSIDVLAVTGAITVAGYNTGVGTITSTGIAAFTFTMPSGIADGNKFFGIAGQSGSSIKFSRWKLEKGTVSTLANDAPPNLVEELWKCQRYLWVGDFDTNTTITTGCSFSADTVVADLVLPVSMRKTSTYTVSYTGSGALMGTGTLTGVTAYSVARVVDNHAKLFLTASGLTAYNIYSLIVTSASLKLIISAEP